MITKEKITENKKKFLGVLRQCTRSGIEELISFLENETDFFLAPASSKYHNNCKGGLVDHSLQVYNEFGNKILIMSSSEDYDNNHILPTDSIILCGLLHDICKINTYHEGLKWIKNAETFYKWKQQKCWEIKDTLPLPHGSKSVYYIQKYVDVTKLEALIITYHMAILDTFDRFKYFNVCSQYPLVMLFQHADHQAALLKEQVYSMEYV